MRGQENVKFAYVYDYVPMPFDQKDLKNPVGCVAVWMPHKGNVPHWGVSFCNPKDKFNKKLARKQALKNGNAGSAKIPANRIFWSIENVYDAVQQKINMLVARFEYERGNPVGKWCSAVVGGKRYVGIVEHGESCGGFELAMPKAFCCHGSGHWYDGVIWLYKREIEEIYA